MRITFLGTGTSMGLPMIGCRCRVCTSADQHNRRLRTSALLEVGGKVVLIDAGPDLRQQALSVGLAHVDAVLVTHSHTDHIAGIDDLRPLTMVSNAAIPIVSVGYSTDDPTIFLISAFLVQMVTSSALGATGFALLIYGLLQRARTIRQPAATTV